MKTVIFNGSPKKTGDTAALIQAFAAHLQGEIIEISHRDRIGPCLDCRHCWTHPGCAVRDDMQAFYPHLEDCGNVVLASPIWFSTLSGPLLTQASRLQTYFAAAYFRNEPPRLRRKRGVLLLAGAEPGTEAPAISTAQTILKHLNAAPCLAVVTSMDTNNLPAKDDAVARKKAREAAELLNQRAR